ncbi:MAG: hypothetical protein M1816_003302 [Peltula sp. TS41687]|nr:MAG: hypothetical protein M1816_003302 [Peltula sp. TS41687]
MTTDLGPVSSVDKIRERCGPIFSSAGFQHITWAGVFGSFSRGKQSAASDVDLIVGFREGTTGDDVYYMPDLEGSLQAALRRDVDVLYMRAVQPLGFMRSQALLTAKTVCEVGTWLPGNRSRAEKLLMVAYDRYKVSLGLMGEISKRLATTTEEQELIQKAENLIYTLRLDDEVAKGVNSFFDVVYYRWATQVSQIVQQVMDGGLHIPPKRIASSCGDFCPRLC